MLPSECLQQARDLITPPGAWTQGAFARTIKGKKVVSSSDRATCFCSIGAISRTSDMTDFAEIDLLERVCSDRIISWNDTPGRTQDEVLAVFDRAIALAKSEGR